MLRLQNLCAVLLLSLPFTRSLTLDVGFAVKIYELLVPLALAVALAEGPLDPGRPGRAVRLWLVFWFVSLFPTAWGLTLILDSDVIALEWARGRFTPLVNALFHTSYLLLDIAALAVFLVALHRGTLTRRTFARWWLIGAMISVGYAVWLNLVHWAGLPLAWALRASEVQTTAMGGLEIVRSGPFEEGNYFGLYLVLSLVLALWSGARFPDRLFVRAIPVLVLGLFLCASPAALALLLLLLVISLFDRATPPSVRAMEAALILAVCAVILRTDLLQELVLDKFSLLLVGGITDAGNVSLVRRLNESYHGWLLFLDYPLGVGIGNFGYFWGRYPELYPWLTVAFTTQKQIPNMVYLEVLTEQGVQGLLLFLAAMGGMLAPLWQRRQWMLVLGLAAMLIYFVVFPTFRLTFLWVFWAFLLVAAAPDVEPRRTSPVG